MKNLDYELTAPRTITELPKPEPVTIRIHSGKNWTDAITVTGRRIGIVNMGFGLWADLIKYGGRCWVDRPIIRSSDHMDHFAVNAACCINPKQCPPWW